MLEPSELGSGFGVYRGEKLRLEKLRAEGRRDWGLGSRAGVCVGLRA